MDAEDAKRVVVVGAGTMGHGIAQAEACGYRTVPQHSGGATSASPFQTDQIDQINQMDQRLFST